MPRSPEYRARKNASRRSKYATDPDYRAAILVQLREGRLRHPPTEEQRGRKNTQSRARMADPQARARKNAKERARTADPAVRALKNAKNRARMADPEKRALKNAKQRARMTNNPKVREQKNAKQRERFATNETAREEKNAKERERLAANPDAHARKIDKDRLRQTERYWDDPKAARAYTNAYYAANANKKRAEARAYKKANPELIQAQVNKRRARQFAAEINDFTADEWHIMQELADHRCHYCKKRYKGRLTMDHIVPLSKGGHHTYSNIIPACRSCNSKKGNRDVIAPVQPFLLLPTTKEKAS